MDVRTGHGEQAVGSELRYAAAAGTSGASINHDTFEALWSCKAREKFGCGVYCGAVERGAYESGGVLRNGDRLF